MASMARNYQIIFYPESAPENFLHVINNWHVKCCLSPLHSLDEDENELKEHYHLNIMFEGKKSYEQVLQMAQELGSKRVAEIKSIYSMTRYLIHFDNPEKQQFIPSDLKSFGGFDYLEYFKDSFSEDSSFTKLEQIIFNNNIQSIKSLIAHLVANDLTNYMGLIRKNSYYFNLLCNSNKN